MNENAGFFSGDWLGAFLIIAVMFGGFGGNGLGWGGNNAALTQMDLNNALAKAFLLDKDAKGPKEKISAYYNYIVDTK